MPDWEFFVPGSPPTVNHMYTRVRGQWNRMAKAPGVEQYQNDLAWLCRAARPSGWDATEADYIRVEYEFHLWRDADCDNLMKAINDGIAGALGVNDRIFLPSVVTKTTGNRTPYTWIGITALLSPMLPRRELPPSLASSSSSFTSPKGSPASRKRPSSS